VEYNGEWCLNPELTKQGGNVDTPALDTYADDQICFYVSGEGYESRQIGCVTIEHDGDRASVRLAACIVACFFNKSLTLTYTVRFPNSEEPQPSPEQVVSVSVPQFPHPGIEEATNGILDLRTFLGDAMATVPVWAYIECAKACWMWIVGEYEDGSDYRLDILSGVPVTDDWKTHGVGAAVLRAELQKLADCSSFELHFSATFCDADDLAEAHAFPAQAFEIEQEALVLPAPEVVEAVGSDLTAWNGRNGVQVKVDYVGNNPKHSISLCWKKADGTCWPLASKPGTTAGAVIFELPAEAVIESMGKTVPITYTVNTACKVQTSPPLNLKISLPTRLETPNILQAVPPRTQNAVLDLKTFAGNASSLEDPMWFLRAGQKCWLRGTGTARNGNPHAFIVYAARTITEAEVTAGVASPVLRSELNKLMDNTSITLTFSVATNGGSLANVTCPERVLLVKQAIAIIEERFVGQTTHTYTQGGIVDTPTMKVTFVSGPNRAGIVPYGNDQYYSGQSYVMCQNVPHSVPPQKHRFDFKHKLESIKFAWVWKQNPGQVTFYDEHHRVLAVHNYPEENKGGFWVEYSPPPGQVISSMEVTVEDYSFIDNFTMSYRL
ncbi:hypothetical protein, partial [Pseudomonas sp. 2822-17]|uniref:hypothetical protein n=1 Tax=Pseudomonas sp. 2822-17 TaxID=1712678 RepID=UPI0013044192